MKFQRSPWVEEPEINLIPLIDILLVLLIFLTATTTFTRFSALGVNLPTASAEQNQLAEIALDVAADGRYALNGAPLAALDTEALAQALRQAAANHDDALLVVYADAQATHQSVVDAMQAARDAGISRLSFAARHQGAK